MKSAIYQQIRLAGPCLPHQDFMHRDSSIKGKQELFRSYITKILREKIKK